MFTVYDLGLVICAALLCSGVVMLSLRVRIGAQGARPTVPKEPLVLLFDAGALHHATDRALQALGLVPGRDDWHDLHEALVARFPDFPEHPCAEGHATCFAMDDLAPQRIDLRRRGDLCWVTLQNTVAQTSEPSKRASSAATSPAARAALTAPHPIWEENAQGRVVWYNTAYETLYKAAHDGAAVHPHRSLFSQVDGTAPNRVVVHNHLETSTDWFELTAIAAAETTLFHATSINAVVAAEDTQRTFVQTLAKTFAHLSIGLAIFDRNGQLLLFNPALIDLTGLKAPFLSARPTMLSFFDALRDNRHMPEPKNYSNWRQDIADVIAAAQGGHYRETWPLETGQTYRVSGRRHPDGATAFLIEDITAEMTLTRNFRVEIEQAQIMVNAASDPMAIFLPSGVLTLCNSAFQERWGVDPDLAFADITLHDCTKIWETSCRRPADKNALRRALTGAIIGLPQTVVLHHDKKGAQVCEITHLATGGVFVRFSKTEIPKPLSRMSLAETG